MVADRPSKATKILTKLNTYRSKVETMAAWNKDAIGQVETMGLILFGIIGRKVDRHVPANEERVEKHLFSALTCSRKRAEFIGEPRHPA